MQKETLKNNYLNYIENATESLKSSQYGAVLKNLYLAKENGDSESWRNDFNSMIMPFWSGMDIVGLELIGCIACCEPVFSVLCPVLCCDFFCCQECCGCENSCFFGCVENFCECFCGC